MFERDGFRNELLLLGRILFSFIFITSGLMKIVDFNSTIAYITSAGVPNGQVVAVIGIIFELLGSIFVLLGWFTKFGAFLLFIFIFTVSFAIHHFWTYPADAVQNQMISFFKNMAMMGGTLYIMVFGAGNYSIDHLLRSDREKEDEWDQS